MKGLERVVDHICGKSAEVIWLSQKKLEFLEFLIWMIACFLFLCEFSLKFFLITLVKFANLESLPTMIWVKSVN